MTAKRVVICGAGAIGLASALYLQRRGHEVTVLDRSPAERTGCSFGNAGMVVPSHFIPFAAPGMITLGLKWMFNPRSPFYIRPRADPSLLDWGLRFARSANVAHVARAAPLLRDLSLRSRELFVALAAESGEDFGLVTRGLIMLCRTEKALAHEATVADEANALGISAEVVGPRRLAELDPGLRMQAVGGVYFPGDCHFTPHRFMSAMEARARQEGVRFKFETSVTGFRQEGTRLAAALANSGEEFDADEFVIAGGSWSPGLVRSLGLNLPMQAGKGYSLTLPRPRSLPRMCSILCEARVAVTPMDGALRVGGTMELSGFDETVRHERVAGILDAFSQYFPDFTAGDFSGLPVWHGFRPCSPDGLPYLGRFGRYANLTAATGHAMMGLSLAPVTGEIIAQLLSGESPVLDLSLLSPDR